MLVSFESAKAYLRVDTHDEDELINGFLASAYSLCANVARLNSESVALIDADPTENDSWELTANRDTFRRGVLLALGYMFEHREDADYGGLVDTLRNLFFAIREGKY